MKSLIAAPSRHRVMVLICCLSVLTVFLSVKPATSVGNTCAAAHEHGRQGQPYDRTNCEKLLASAEPASVATRARVFRPFTASGRSRLHTKTRRGECFTGSLATVRRDAWRCIVGNGLIDPCFSSGRA